MPPFEPVQFGKYRLIQPLAQGGMAEIFLAKQQGPKGYEKTVVIKRILDHWSSSPEFVGACASPGAEGDRSAIVRLATCRRRSAREVCTWQHSGISPAIFLLRPSMGGPAVPCMPTTRRRCATGAGS